MILVLVREELWPGQNKVRAEEGSKPAELKKGIYFWIVDHSILFMVFFFLMGFNEVDNPPV